MSTIAITSQDSKTLVSPSEDETTDKPIATARHHGMTGHIFAGPVAVVENSATRVAASLESTWDIKSPTRLVLPIEFPISWGLSLLPAFQSCIAEFVNKWVSETLPAIWEAQMNDSPGAITLADQ